MDFRHHRENESWYEKIWDYLTSIFQREPPSLLETWEEIRPTPTTSEASSSSTDEEPRQAYRRSRSNQPKFLVCIKQ